MSSLYYDNIERPRLLGRYIIEEKSTVRAAAVKFGVSKSTVHKDVSHRLAKIDPIMHKEVAKILSVNKSERHIRGGNATKQKYKTAKNQK